MEKFEEIERFEITGRGTLITAKLPRDFTEEEFTALIGSEIEISGEKYICRGIDAMRTAMPPSKFMAIALLVTPIGTNPEGEVS